MLEAVFILNITATLMLTGVIWIIQLVQYPFFSEVSSANFSKYHAAHTFWITPVVAPLMIAELVSSLLLVVYPPPAIAAVWLWLGLLLALLVWLSTFLIQIPLHNRLARGFDRQAHLRLVRTNWIRTAVWTLRAALVICFLRSTIDL